MEERIWKSGSDVIAVWKRQPYPNHVNKWDITGDQVLTNLPMEDHRENVYEKWTPPSEDPHYQKKWAYWKSLFSREG